MYHKFNKKIHVTVNIYPHEKDLDGLKEYLIALDRCGVDAIIVSSLTFFLLLSKMKEDKRTDYGGKTMILKELREATGFTAAEAAKVLGFPVKTWESWENGEKSPAPFIEKQIIDKLNKMKR